MSKRRERTPKKKPTPCGCNVHCALFDHSVQTEFLQAVEWIFRLALIGARSRSPSSSSLFVPLLTHMQISISYFFGRAHKEHNEMSKQNNNRMHFIDWNLFHMHHRYIQVSIFQPHHAHFEIPIIFIKKCISEKKNEISALQLKFT